MIAVAVVLAATAACDSSSRARDRATSTSSRASASAVPAGAPDEARSHPGDWWAPGRDYDNSRATTTSRITAANVDTLTVAYEADAAGALTTVPLIVGDTVYAEDTRGRVHAVDRATGQARWTSEPSGFDIGPFGVAVAGGRVFAVHGSTGVVALDARTGAQLWVRDITATPTVGVDIQPVVYEGIVFAATVPISLHGFYTGGDRGVLHALDAATGKDRWTFDTVDSADVWGNPAVNSGGGAWYPPAIDPARGLVYFGIANPAPFPGTAAFPNGSSRPGPNLYTDSVVALDVHTGKLRWYHQVHPHDLFDRDLVHTLISRDAKGRETLVATGKGGVVVGLDAGTGTQRWRTAIGVHHDDELTKLDGPTEVAPGTYGGVLTPPATADGVVYAATVNAPTVLKPNETAYFGATLGAHDGQVTAVDTRSGAVRWKTDVPGDPLGGVTVVNDLVFTATLQGTIIALDRANGQVAWKVKAPGGINGWMAAAGDLLVVPVGNANPPRLVVYRLPRR
ncbi:MAG: PQQ-binding-like beta-propeller repeat protein [Acidimicrobiia bacterium]